MNPEQITNIAIKIGEYSTKANIAFCLAIIGAVASIVCAIIAGYFAWKLNKENKEHEKQWAFINKRSWLIDQAIDIMIRMLFNKLLIVDNNDKEAFQNFFLLQKDALVIESQMLVYGPMEIAQALANFKELIISTPNEKFRESWGTIYQKGQESLLLCRKHLGRDISEKYDVFTEELMRDLPSPEESKGIIAATVSLGSTLVVSSTDPTTGIIYFKERKNKT